VGHHKQDFASLYARGWCVFTNYTYFSNEKLDACFKFVNIVVTILSST